MEKDQNYLALLNTLKTEIANAQLKVAFTVNEHLLKLYWRIGSNILAQQSVEGWGAKVIDRLADDLKESFADMEGISSRNLKYMRAFASAYPEFMQVPLAQIGEPEAIGQAPLAQLTWYHHITLLDKVKVVRPFLPALGISCIDTWVKP